MDNHDTQPFAASNKAEWLRRVEKELKGRSMEELDWQLEERVRIGPVATSEDVPTAAPPITAGRTINNWEIGEYIYANDTATANAQALQALEGGVSAPLFHLHHQPTVEEIGQLLAGIEPSFVSINCAPLYPDKDPAELFRDLVYYLRSQGHDLANIRGSVDFDPFLDWSEPPFPPLVRLLRFVSRYMPGFRVLQVNGRPFHTGIQHTSEELALIIAKGVAYLNEATRHGADTATVNAHLQFTVTLSTSYYLEIAKLRALRILWANVLDGYGLADAPLPLISAHPAEETQDEDIHANMLRATTQGLAAAVGGANQIYLLPADHGLVGETSDFTRRIARNVQHLLQIESHVDWVVDPAAGSYFLEQLTHQLAEAAWSEFQEIERKGGFLVLQEL